MATYKLIQDVEAEDHILGPLTLRQFIFALIAIFFYYICFILLKRNAGFLLVAFLPPALFFTFFAIPFGRDQPTEIWALAKIRFFLKPRKRIWNQSGIKELVTITVPKKIEIQRTDGLSQTEVKSRLQALANTLDSRGWAIKNANLNTYAMPNPLTGMSSSERLIDIGNIPREVPGWDVQASDDILDEVSNPIAQQFSSMINRSTEAHRQEVIEKMNKAIVETPPTPINSQQPVADYWFMNRPAQPTAGQSMFSGPQLIQPGTAITVPHTDTADDAALAAQLKSKSTKPSENANMRTLKPVQQASSQLSVDSSQQSTDNREQTTSPPGLDPAILSLANNNDLNVSTLAREAQKAKGEGGQDEVVISLH